MIIGIIGTGHIGGTLTRILTQRGHEVLITNSRGAEGARSLAEETGAKAVDIQGVLSGIDLLIISIPFPGMLNLPKGLLDNLSSDVPVIDTGNYYPGVRDAQIPELDAGEVQSVWSSRLLGRSIIKAFNDITVYSLQEYNSRSNGDPGRLALAVAGNNDEHKRFVMKFIDEEVGFDPVDSGSLEESWRQQPATPAYCCNWDAETLPKKLMAAVEGEAIHALQKWAKRFEEMGWDASPDQIIALNRSLYE